MSRGSQFGKVFRVNSYTTSKDTTHGSRQRPVLTIRGSNNSSPKLRTTGALPVENVSLRLKDKGSSAVESVSLHLDGLMSEFTLVMASVNDGCQEADGPSWVASRFDGKEDGLSD
ncbi:hypothetical protein HAX54_034678 [Datura stramonium]|uniref:Uncharacterized protein n=1 Tax=Datura stramonium TaxID=4076 RepID=A0ABS8VG04_DATST|nr:hypothetical protein [Datura stramonium]